MDPYTKYSNYKPLSAMIAHDNVPQYIIVHHSASQVDDFNSIQRYHITDPTHLWENVGYHAVINRDGTLHYGRPDLYHGSHVKEQDINKKSLGICLCGDFDKTMPTDAQIQTLKEYLILKTSQYNIPVTNIQPHRHYALGADGKPYKSCYGNKLGETWARDLVPTIAPTPKEAIKNQIISLLNQL